MMSNSEMLIRLISAAALGSLIGFERERLLWAAGIRTHMLVCVGSCLIMLVSQYGFSNILLTQSNVVLDPSRIAAQVVSGIGFLGAGSILARGEIVKGTHHSSKYLDGGSDRACGRRQIVSRGRRIDGDHPDHPRRYQAARGSLSLAQPDLHAEGGSREQRPDAGIAARDIVAARRPGEALLVESRDPQGTDQLSILLSKVSSQDIASYPSKLQELDGVRQVSIVQTRQRPRRQTHVSDMSAGRATRLAHRREAVREANSRDTTGAAPDSAAAGAAAGGWSGWSRPTASA